MRARLTRLTLAAGFTLLAVVIGAPSQAAQSEPGIPDSSPTTVKIVRAKQAVELAAEGCNVVSCLRVEHISGGWYRISVWKIGFSWGCTPQPNHFHIWGPNVNFNTTHKVRGCYVEEHYSPWNGSGTYCAEGWHRRLDNNAWQSMGLACVTV